MLKLIDQSLLSTKTDHNYWKYSRYSDAISGHIEWIIESIKNSKDGHIRVRINDFLKELGSNFVVNHYTSIFTGLRHALFKEGVIIDVGRNDIFIMRLANHEEKLSIIDRKSKRKCRNKDLDPDSSSGFGYISEVLTAKFLGIKTCFDMYNSKMLLYGNFNYRKFDMYHHENFGRIDSKGSKLLSTTATCCHNEGCYYWIFNTRKNKIPDFFFCIGYNETRTEVICIYIIPNENIITNAIYINKNWDQHEDPYYWYKQDPKPWNDLFLTLKLEDCPILKTRS